MKERLVNFSYLAAGHIVQDIVILDDSISGEEMVRMLNSGEAFTTVHEDNDVITPDGTVIGKVRWSDTELEYSDFQIEAGEYEQESADRVFLASRLARQGAVGEFVSEDDMSVDAVLHMLKEAGDNPPVGLAIEEGHQDKTGNDLLREIEYFERGLMNLMTIAHAAGAKGQEIK